MAAAKSKPSAADRQKIVAKLQKQLKKEFGGLPKYEQRPVLETMVFATLLEEATFETAEAVFARLAPPHFIDWNEVRVSTIAELEPVLEGLPDPPRCAYRIRGLLHYVYDHQYSYDFDAIRRKTLELAQKQLSKIKFLTPFARNWLLQVALGNHVIPADRKMVHCAIWLGLIPPGTTDETAADALKSYTRKADGPAFTWFLKALSVSPRAEIILDTDVSVKAVESEDTDVGLTTADERLSDVLSGRAKRRKAAADKKKAADRKKAAKKAVKKKAAKKAPAQKKAARKAPAKKKVAKKKVVKKKKK